jgi:glucan biosynthesis protein
MPRPGAGARRRLACAAALALATLVVTAVAHAAFGLDNVAAKAEKLAQDPFQDTKGSVPDWLLKISYDQWRDIRFRPAQALWADRRSSFAFYDRIVAMNVVDQNGRFNRDLTRCSREHAGESPRRT